MRASKWRRERQDNEPCNFKFWSYARKPPTTLRCHPDFMRRAPGAYGANSGTKHPKLDIELAAYDGH